MMPLAVTKVETSGMSSSNRDFSKATSNRGKKPVGEAIAKPLEAIPHDRDSESSPTVIPQSAPTRAPITRQEDPISKADGSITNVRRVEESYSTFPPRGTDTHFKPIKMSSDPRTTKHKKPTIITTDSYEESSSSLEEKFPDEYSAEQVSQKVFDFLEIDEPESLSLRDDTIDSRASPIPNEEVIDLDSPRFEYYEEIEFKKPVHFGQTQQIEKQEIHETTDMPEMRPEYLNKDHFVDDDKPQTHRYIIKGVTDPRQVKQFKYVPLSKREDQVLEEFDVSSFDPETVRRIRQGTRTIKRTTRRKIITKIDGDEETQEIVEDEPTEEEIISEFETPEVIEVREPGRLTYVSKKEGAYPSEKTERELRGKPVLDFTLEHDEKPDSFRIKKSVLRPEAKEFTPSSSLKKVTHINLPQDGTLTSETKQPTSFDIMIEDPSLIEKTKFIPNAAELPSKESKTQSILQGEDPRAFKNIISEEEFRSLKPQRKKKKKRRDEKTTKEPDEIGDEPEDDENEDSSLEDDIAIEKITETEIEDKNKQAKGTKEVIKSGPKEDKKIKEKEQKQTFEKEETKEDKPNKEQKPSFFQKLIFGKKDRSPDYEKEKIEKEKTKPQPDKPTEKKPQEKFVDEKVKPTIDEKVDSEKKKKAEEGKPEEGKPDYSEKIKPKEEPKSIEKKDKRTLEVKVDTKGKEPLDKETRNEEPSETEFVENEFLFGRKPKDKFLSEKKGRSSSERETKPLDKFEENMKFLEFEKAHDPRQKPIPEKLSTKKDKSETVEKRDSDESEKPKDVEKTKISPALPDEKEKPEKAELKDDDKTYKKPQLTSKTGMAEDSEKKPKSTTFETDHETTTKYQSFEDKVNKKDSRKEEPRTNEKGNEKEFKDEKPKTKDEYKPEQLSEDTKKEYEKKILKEIKKKDEPYQTKQDVFETTELLKQEKSKEQPTPLEEIKRKDKEESKPTKMAEEVKKLLDSEKPESKISNLEGRKSVEKEKFRPSPESKVKEKDELQKKDKPEKISDKELVDDDMTKPVKTLDKKPSDSSKEDKPKKETKPKVQDEKSDPLKPQTLPDRDSELSRTTKQKSKSPDKDQIQVTVGSKKPSEVEKSIQGKPKAEKPIDDLSKTNVLKQEPLEEDKSSGISSETQKPKQPKKHKVGFIEEDETKTEEKIDKEKSQPTSKLSEKIQTGLVAGKPEDDLMKPKKVDDQNLTKTETLKFIDTEKPKEKDERDKYKKKDVDETNLKETKPGKREDYKPKLSEKIKTAEFLDREKPSDEFKDIKDDTKAREQRHEDLKPTEVSDTKTRKQKHEDSKPTESVKETPQIQEFDKPEDDLNKKSAKGKTSPDKILRDGDQTKELLQVTKFEGKDNLQKPEKVGTKEDVTKEKLLEEKKPQTGEIVKPEDVSSDKINKKEDEKLSKDPKNEKIKDTKGIKKSESKGDEVIKESRPSEIKKGKEVLDKKKEEDDKKEGKPSRGIVSTTEFSNEKLKTEKTSADETTELLKHEMMMDEQAKEKSKPTKTRKSPDDEKLKSFGKPSILETTNLLEKEKSLEDKQEKFPKKEKTPEKGKSVEGLPKEEDSAPKEEKPKPNEKSFSKVIKTKKEKSPHEKVLPEGVVGSDEVNKTEKDPKAVRDSSDEKTKDKSKVDNIQREESPEEEDHKKKKSKKKAKDTDEFLHKEKPEKPTEREMYAQKTQDTKTPESTKENLKDPRQGFEEPKSIKEKKTEEPSGERTAKHQSPGKEPRKGYFEPTEVETVGHEKQKPKDESEKLISFEKPESLDEKTKKKKSPEKDITFEEKDIKNKEKVFLDSQKEESIGRDKSFEEDQLKKKDELQDAIQVKQKLSPEPKKAKDTGEFLPKDKTKKKSFEKDDVPDKEGKEEDTQKKKKIDEGDEKLQESVDQRKTLKKEDVKPEEERLMEVLAGKGMKPKDKHSGPEKDTFASVLRGRKDDEEPGNETNKLLKAFIDSEQDNNLADRVKVTEDSLKKPKEDESKEPEIGVDDRSPESGEESSSFFVSMAKKVFGFGGGKKSKTPEPRKDKSKTPEPVKDEKDENAAPVKDDKTKIDKEKSSEIEKDGKKQKRKAKGKERPEEAEKDDKQDPTKNDKDIPVKETTLGWDVPAEDTKQPAPSSTVLPTLDPSHPDSRKSFLEKQPQHGAMSAPVAQPEEGFSSKLIHQTSFDSKKPETTPDSKIKSPSPPSYADLFTQTSPQASPRSDMKEHKGSQTKEPRQNEEGIQTDVDKKDTENQTDLIKGTLREEKPVSEKFQQTSKPQSPELDTTDVSSQTSPHKLRPEELGLATKVPDKQLKKEKEKELPDERKKPIDSRESKDIKGKPKEDDSYGVHVTAKVSLKQPDIPGKPKKERKRKWEKELGEEGNVEVRGTVSIEDEEFEIDADVQTPKDFIEGETQSSSLNVGVTPTSKAEIQINVKQRDKSPADFIDRERKTLERTEGEMKDPKDKKGRKARKGGKDRESAFISKESGTNVPMGLTSGKDFDSSNEEDDLPEKGKYGVGFDIQVGDEKDRNKPQKKDKTQITVGADVTIDPNLPTDQKTSRKKNKGQKPEEDENYKVYVDVKVKTGEDPTKKSAEGKRMVDIGTNFPSPRESGLSEPEELNIYLLRAKDIGKKRLKKLKNIQSNTGVAPLMVPSPEIIPEKDIRTNLDNIQGDIDKLRDAITRRDSITVRRIFVYLIKNIDDWMETVEYRILQNSKNLKEGPNRDKVNQLKSLKDEVGTIERGVTDLLRNVKSVPTSGDSDVVHQLGTYLEQLQPQISEISDTAEVEEESAVKDLSRWEEFLNGVNNVSVMVEETRQNLENVIDSDSNSGSKIEELEKIEAANKDYADKAIWLITLAKDLAKDYPNQDIPPETYSTYEQTKIIHNNLNAERDRLLQLLSLEDEYEQTLKEFAQIIEVAENLVESPITITSLPHLQEEMQKHRKFFVNLSHCRAILESLESHLDGETRGSHNQLHKKLHAKASSILDKAASRAQQMAMAASRWTVLDKGVRNEQQWLQVVHQRLPDLQQVKSSDYDQYVSLYQSLASDTAIHHAKILQLMDVANKLQDVITCVGLEKLHEDYLEVILKLQEEIDDSVEKLQAFQAIWTLYEIMTNKLDTWMKTAEEELKNLKIVPGKASMRQFWELKAQFELHNRLKQEMGNNFEKAVQFLPIADEMTQRQVLGKLEDRLKKLEREIKDIQDSAMATLSAQDVPVNEKLKLLEEELNELNDTVDDLHGIIKTDEELNLYIERLQVLSGRLDTLQEELGRLGLLPATESEKVGYLLGLARRLEQQLLEELQESTLLREKLLALQKGLGRVRRNQSLASTILDQCAAAEPMSSDIVEQAVNTCENVSADLSDQWQDLMYLRQVLHNLPMRLRVTVSPIKVEREISQLQEIHAVLEERCGGLLNLLRTRLSMWRKFEKQLEKVQENVQETDYMVELLTLQGSVDLDRLQTATDRLKDLHDSVGEREDLIKELKRLAEPLANSCSPEVAAQLNAQVDEAVNAWNGTRKNLYQIVDKYNDAVKLWKNYKEGRDDMRKWIDQQWTTLDLLQAQPEKAVEQIKEFKETLTTQKARLDELKKLVAQIAADIGLDPGGLLECEVEDLGKRLEDVKETLTTLTSVAESKTQGKDVCKDELIKAKNFLGSVQKSLNVVDENGDENTLSTLRDHLLALGKTESHVQNVKEKSIKMNEKPHEIRNESSVVEILELWQQVFRETFQQYYRLSAKLVRGQDGAAALQLWQEYLRHVQTFLAGSLPEDYDGLRETQRLCEVHQNLLTSQQSVLNSRKDDPTVRDFSQALQEQFNSLANLHNETLIRIMDRHNEVNKRLKLWDVYRHDQSKLLAWLRDMTRDQSRLQLRYIHLRRLPKLLEQIELLLSRIPQGKNQIKEQQKQQDLIVKFCDEALATSIKMESVATAERINNLEASLKSWKDFLHRIGELYRNYETELEKVEKVCDEVTSELAAPAPVSFSAIQSRLDLCRDLRNRISDYSKNIEEASVTYDQLKESLSPHDMKMLSQRLWLMGQRQGDLEHHLLLQILWLEDRLETQQAFGLRHARFINWANDLINRFEKNSSTDTGSKYLDFETRAKRLEAEIEIELGLKNREYNALHAMANNIIDLSKEDSQEKRKAMTSGSNRIDYEIMKTEVERKIKEVDETWNRLQNLKSVRLEKKSKLKATMSDLWKRIEDLKVWLSSIEEKLEAPTVIEKSSKKCIDKLIKDHETIQESIEKQSGNVGEVLNLCELFLADPAVDVNGIDTNDLETAQQGLEKRWKAICLSSAERKSRILGAWELLLQLSKICKEQEKWIGEKEKSLQKIAGQTETPGMNEIQDILGLLEKEKLELDSKAPALKILDSSYSKLAQESRLPADNIQQLAGPAKALIAKWHNLYVKLKNISDKMERIAKLRDDFIRNRNSSMVLLTNISAKLIQAEILSNPKKRLKKINELEKELEKEGGYLRAADETSLELMKMCSDPQNVSATQILVDEYQIMWKELKKRFADIKNNCLESLESKEIQVSTLAFEADSEVQVDTLPHMDRLTSKDAYGLELDVALRECDQNLKGLESILRTPEGEEGITAPNHKTLAKIIATCTSSVELVQHLNQTLRENCGLDDLQARTAVVKEMTIRFQDVVARARQKEKQLREASERGRLTCPICSCRNWEQLENDLWRLEQWIQYAEAIQKNRPSLPSNIEALEDIIHDHKELLTDLDSHKSIVVALNIVGDHLADHAEEVDRAKALRERLKALNNRWDNVCSRAAQWQGKLQHALIENPEFHETISDLMKWLDNTESIIRNSEPIDLAQDRVVLESQYRKFKTLSKELERCEPRVQSLQESAIQLLDKEGSARERLNGLRLRLTGLRRLIKVYLLRLGAVLGSESVEALDQTLMSLSQEMLDGADSMGQIPSSSTAHTNGEPDIDTTSFRRGLRFLGRVFRASLPIQALMLLLLGAATLVPDEYYSCAFSNNARLQSYYPKGPPPI